MPLPKTSVHTYDHIINWVEPTVSNFRCSLKVVIFLDTVQKMQRFCFEFRVECRQSEKRYRDVTVK